MPFYEYECSNCKFYVEAMQKISDEPLKQCPSCGQPALVRLISAPVFRLKGGGWYETDFKGDKESKRNLSGSDSDTSEGDSKASKERLTKTKPAQRKGDKTSAAKPAEQPVATKANRQVVKAKKQLVKAKKPAPKPKQSAPKAKAKAKPASRKSPARKAGGAAKGKGGAAGKLVKSPAPRAATRGGARKVRKRPVASKARKKSARRGR